MSLQLLLQLFLHENTFCSLCGTHITHIQVCRYSLIPPAAPDPFPRRPPNPQVKILSFAFVDMVRFMVQQNSYPSKCGYVHRSSTLNESAWEESWLHHSTVFLSPEIYKPNEITCPEGIYMGHKSFYCTRPQQQHISDLYLRAYTLQFFTLLRKNTKGSCQFAAKISQSSDYFRGNKNSSYLSFHPDFLLSFIQNFQSIMIVYINYECPSSCSVGSINVESPSFISTSLLIANQQGGFAAQGLS